MIEIYDGRNSFHQWDLNVKVTSTDFTVGEEIHFGNMRISVSPTVKTYELNGAVVADVPNFLLQTANPIKVYHYVRGEDSSQTIDQRTFLVEQRPQPSDYYYTETELYSLRADAAKTLKEVQDKQKNLEIAESERVANESAREVSETHRLNNEIDRCDAETERIAAETSRKNAESQRVNTESKRVTAESLRVEAEQSRVDAENLRQANFEALPNNIGNAVKGYASGKVVRVDDVSSITHRAKVKVSGENIDPTTVTVTRCGKNLLDVTKAELLVVGASGSERYGVVFDKTGTYTFSCNTEKGIAVKVVTDGEYGDYVTLINNVRHTFTLAENQYLIIYQGSEGVLFNRGLENAQIEKGDTKTDYEPYTADTYTPAADGTCEIVSLAPTMTLLTDTEGVTIDLEYNQDTTKALENVKSDLRELDNTVAEIILNGGGGGDTPISNYYTKDEIDKQMGDVESVLDAIIDLQESIIGGA